QNYGTGVDRLVGTPIWESGITITTVSGAAAINIAEHVLCTMLMLAHGFPEYMRGQYERRWIPDTALGSRQGELHGQTVGLVGLGSIGREIARLCRAFRM